MNLAAPRASKRSIGSADKLPLAAPPGRDSDSSEPNRKRRRSGAACLRLADVVTQSSDSVNLRSHYAEMRRRHGPEFSLLAFSRDDVERLCTCFPDLKILCIEHQYVLGVPVLGRDDEKILRVTFRTKRSLDDLRLFLDNLEEEELSRQIAAGGSALAGTSYHRAWTLPIITQ
jgi:hypothetical protein